MDSTGAAASAGSSAHKHVDLEMVPVPVLLHEPSLDTPLERHESLHELTDQSPPLAPVSDYLDGGYGWIITASSFVLCFQYLGILYSWGVFQAELAQRNFASSFQLSAIGATAAFALSFVCLPASILLVKKGPRITAMIGVIGVSVSLILSGFSTQNYGGLFFLQGISFGAFGGLVYLTAYSMPSQYFLRRRGLSTGIASCGAGIGGAVWSVIIQRLLVATGLAWTFRILGLVTMIICTPAALLLRTGYTPPPDTDNHTSHSERGIFSSSLFNRIFIAYAMASYPFFIPPYFIPEFTQSVGLSAAQGALFSAVYNVASGVGRIGFGSLADSLLGSVNAWMLSLTFISLSTFLVWPHATSQSLLILLVVICGCGSGGFFALQASVITRVVGSRRLQKAIGWAEVGASFGHFAGPVSAGALLDAFGGPDRGAAPYLPAMYLVGATTAAACLLVLSVRLSISRSIWVKI